MIQVVTISVLILAVFIDLANSEDKRRFIQKEEDPEYLKTVYTKMIGYERVKQIFKIDSASMGNINLLPYSLRVSLSGNKNQIVDCAGWFNPIEKDVPKYTWNDFIGVYNKFNEVVSKHPWIEKWRAEKPNRTVNADIYGVTPNTEEDLEYFVKSAWDNAGLKGEVLYEVYLREGNLWQTIYFSEESDSSLMPGDYHPNTTETGYTIIASNGEKKSIKIKQEANTPESYYYKLACSYAEKNDLENTISKLQKAFNSSRNMIIQIPEIMKRPVFKQFLENEKFRKFLQKVSDEFENSNKMNESWLLEDKESIINLLKSIQIIEKGIVPFFKGLEYLDVREERNILHKTFQYEATQGGGYVSFWIKVAAFKDKIAIINIESYVNDNDYLNIVLQRDNNLKQLFEKYFHYNGGYEKKYIYKYTNKELYAEMKTEFAEEFGGYKEVEAISKYSEDYELLLSPLNILDFGEICYESAVKPNGRIASDKLMDNNKTDLLNNILRGYNPEGRLYAMQALLILANKKKYTLGKSDVDVINKILKQKIDIKICNGCMVSKEKIHNVLDVFKLKELLLENEVKVPGNNYLEFILFSFIIICLAGYVAFKWIKNKAI